MASHVNVTGQPDGIINHPYTDTNNTISTQGHYNQNQVLDESHEDTTTNDWTNMIDDEHSGPAAHDWTDIMDKKISNNDMLTQYHNVFVTAKPEEKEKKEEKQKLVEHVDIEDIKLVDVKNINDLNLLEKSSMIAKNLKFQFNKRHDDDKIKFVKWMTQSLEWLRDVMYELSARTFQLKIDDLETQTLSPKSSISLSQEDQNNTQTNKKIQNISRNSYKFCEFGHTCRFNYDKTQKCYAQHYVFNLVHLDIVDILGYIANIDITCCRAQDMSEIKTSINTITYVINHMSEELNQLKITSPQCYADYENRLYRFRSVCGFKQRTKKKSYPTNIKTFVVSRSNQKDIDREFSHK